MKKLKLTAAVLALSTGLIFTGCSGEKSESGITKQESAVKTEGNSKEKDTPSVKPMVVDFKTKIYENDEFSIEIPENWTADDQSNPSAIVQVYDKEKITPEFTPNIALTKSVGTMPDDANEIKKQMEEQMSTQKDMGVEIKKSEIIDCSFGQFFYIENSFKLTDEILDKWIKDGMITKEQVEQGGGRKAVIKKMTTSQFQIYLKKDGVDVIIGGTYDDTSYEEMKEVGFYIAETLKGK